MNCYTFDRIEKDEDGCHWGYLGEQICEVFHFSSDDTEEQLESDGFAKCDAPDWDETMLVEESHYACLKGNYWDKTYNDPAYYWHKVINDSAENKQDDSWLDENEEELRPSNRILAVTPEEQKINLQMHQALKQMYEQGKYSENQQG